MDSAYIIQDTSLCPTGNILELHSWKEVEMLTYWKFTVQTKQFKINGSTISFEAGFQKY